MIQWILGVNWCLVNCMKNKYPYIGSFINDANQKVIVFFFKKCTGYCLYDEIYDYRINKVRDNWSEDLFEFISYGDRIHSKK